MSPRFRYFNSNPDEKFVGDCVVRAISAACDADWDSIKGTEKMMALLEYNKDPGAEGLDDYGEEKITLVRFE